MALLRDDDVAQIEGAGVEHDADQDEADRHFVAHHLRGRPERREERIFGVGRPAGDDHAVNAERACREDVEQPDIDVGEHHARLERDHRPDDQRDGEGDDRRDQEQALVRAGRDDRFLEEDLQPVGEALQQAPRADHVGPAAKRDRRPDLALGIDDHRHRQHQRQRDDEDADDRGEEPRPVVARAPMLEESRSFRRLLELDALHQLLRAALHRRAVRGRSRWSGRSRRSGSGSGLRPWRRASAATTAGRSGRRGRAADIPRPSAARSWAKLSNGSFLPASSLTARRIAQSSRASPGGKAAFSPRCTRPSVLT